MKKILVIGMLASTVISCNNSGDEKKENGDSTDTKTSMLNALTDAQKADGWELLFDGKTTNGWHKYGGNPVGAAWKVADGTLYLDTATKADWQVKDGGDIVSDQDFENFDLKLEWKLAKNGNSGIIFYVNEDSAKYTYTWNTGPEMQILDNEGHPDGKIEKHHAGDLYDLIASTKPSAKPIGEWNQAEIKCVDGKLDLYLNGENVVSTTMWDDNWKKLVAGSKFATMTGFGTYKTGKIALQDHGNEVWFRNVMIKRL